MRQCVNDDKNFYYKVDNTIVFLPHIHLIVNLQNIQYDYD